MKQLFFTILFMFVCIPSIYADRREVILNPPGNLPDHSDWPIPADEPDVYYDTTDQVVIIDGTGYVTYYDIEITSTSDWTVYVSTQVNGSYDTIDVSSLPQGEYVITIDSPTGNSFEGFFDTY